MYLKTAILPLLCFCSAKILSFFSILSWNRLFLPLSIITARFLHYFKFISPAYEWGIEQYSRSGLTQAWHSHINILPSSAGNVSPDIAQSFTSFFHHHFTMAAHKLSCDWWMHSDTLPSHGIPLISSKIITRALFDFIY